MDEEHDLRGHEGPSPGSRLRPRLDPGEEREDQGERREWDDGQVHRATVVDRPGRHLRSGRVDRPEVGLRLGLEAEQLEPADDAGPCISLRVARSSWISAISSASVNGSLLLTSSISRCTVSETCFASSLSTAALASRISCSGSKRSLSPPLGNRYARGCTGDLVAPQRAPYWAARTRTSGFTASRALNGLGRPAPGG